MAVVSRRGFGARPPRWRVRRLPASSLRGAAPPGFGLVFATVFATPRRARAAAAVEDGEGGEGEGGAPIALLQLLSPNGFETLETLGTRVGAAERGGARAQAADGGDDDDDDEQSFVPPRLVHSRRHGLSGEVGGTAS